MTPTFLLKTRSWLLMQIVPRAWWKNLAFSQFMADFSEPMV
jgi:hypothetical protein